MSCPSKLHTDFIKFACYIQSGEKCKTNAQIFSPINYFVMYGEVCVVQPETGEDESEKQQDQAPPSPPQNGPAATAPLPQWTWCPHSSHTPIAHVSQLAEIESINKLLVSNIAVIYSLSLHLCPSIILLQNHCYVSQFGFFYKCVNITDCSSSLLFFFFTSVAYNMYLHLKFFHTNTHNIHYMYNYLCPKVLI